MKATYRSLLEKYKGKRILVIGDFILDVYLKGQCARLSPEAPVPVVDVLSRRECAGGAANAAANLHALGARVIFCTVIGAGPDSRRALQVLKKQAVQTRFVVQDNDRQTLIKTRVSAPQQAIVRYDEGTTAMLSPDTESRVIRVLQENYAHCDAILIADYNKGVVTPGVIRALKALKEKRFKMIAVDSKKVSAYKSLRPTIIKPNYEEALQLLELDRSGTSRASQLAGKGPDLFKEACAELTMLTLDSEGALLFEQDQFICHQPVPPVKASNVSGAGDTFISACLLSLLAGAGSEKAMEIANTAAIIAIQKADTALCHNQELAAYYLGNDKLIGNRNRLGLLCHIYKSQGKRIVFTNGCFDILHRGHVLYLDRAKALGDILIVGVNTDESIKRLKGSKRPINRLSDRMEVLAALQSVDHIIPFGHAGDDTPVELIRQITPDVFVKGGDYTEASLPEASVVKSLGAEVVLLPYVKDHSTTGIIDKIRHINGRVMKVG